MVLPVPEIVIVEKDVTRSYGLACRPYCNAWDGSPVEAGNCCVIVEADNVTRSDVLGSWLHYVA